MKSNPRLRALNSNRQQILVDIKTMKRKSIGMTGYTKLFGSIVASTIWREDNETRIVWITMLAMANKDGIVEASVPGLADLSRVTVEACRASVIKLESPDQDSRTKDNEGRRIKAVDGGWLVLNHAKYRAKMNNDERRDYLRVKQAEWRERKHGVNKRSGLSTPSTQSDSEAEAETKEGGMEAPILSEAEKVNYGQSFKRITARLVELKDCNLEPFVTERRNLKMERDRIGSIIDIKA